MLTFERPFVHHDPMSINRRLAATAANLLPEHKPPGSPGQILEAALKLFAECGYAGASVREVAAASGVKPATIYAHYPSKEHILAELCRIGHEEQHRSVRAAVLNSGADPRDQIVAYVRAHVGMHTAFPMLAVVANAELHVLSAELGATTFTLRQQSEQLLADIIQRGLDKGVFNVPNAWLAVAAIGGMGLRVAYWYAPDYHLEAREVAEVYAEYALRILAVSERRSGETSSD
ncbi:transcriptional regulator, TetR family [mine drainage metagenome]|uniref:Transcriptional regulator, TetR family n=2 Tax=mine drainage metagenome TaxID=410659 RepID=T1CE39_9ZZZZ